MAKQLRVERVRAIFGDGNHNAFTDLCRFKGQFYLTFRSCPDGHMLFTSSSIVVLTSKDGEEWEKVHSFNVPERDVRDPHFLVFNDSLFVYSGTWLVPLNRDDPHEMNDHLGYAAWSIDGRKWQGPRALEGTAGHYIWRAATHAGLAYLVGRRKHGFAATVSREQEREITEAVLMRSSDGLSFDEAGFFTTSYGD